MSELHEVCRFVDRPINHDYVFKLKNYLKEGIPATYTLEEAYHVENDIEDKELSSTTTPLHIIASHIPQDATEDEEAIILEMLNELLLWGAGWSLIDKDDQTPGCILDKRGFHGSEYWNTIVNAGVRAEILLRKVEDNIEFIEDESVNINEETIGEEADNGQSVNTKADDDEDNAIQEIRQQLRDDPSNTTSTYLKTKLEYKDGALVTKERGDGVMMSWEETLMQAGCDSMFKNQQPDNDHCVLNIGFGMGIIDAMIQKKKPRKHYICEAHPDVLAKMKEEGWMNKENVVVLSGKWQDQVSELLSKGVFFDGIYYDTYSEHYEDMLDLFDLVVGLLKPEGVFSFFNGLGADRRVVYDVYRKLVELDLNNYGLKVSFKELVPPKETLNKPTDTGDSVWDDIRRAYWSCPVYYHPEAEFM
ncbi:Arginine N5 methyltransferase [Komagataella phaffii CBS 7435]|uniref:Arginine N-methyltransferase 2 n=2 Tax=Komagataella phaffii TaxID=460519 RepID=C4QXG2_KOMPG|nr:Arginine methyltransferase [Komagataella phaffii GS115]AOA61274.1 GQ67_02079T0 [Komagataella phaffii]CAH2446748.1 Arginine N5 methyltransferase [Komagataella phaffii CBS 7435]AOA65754.1 GQ68_02094T0 [Komagataella phaffii GS115]CAY67935.1 Arginine methyltransferase [Komagataella phaffii GS115]CCA37013.1 Arginine N5 methyltransferase [Komagataella phaffii CBS 7435]